MSTGGLKKRYTSAMEKIIKNAVSETSKVLETIIAELKAELIRVKSENENLMIRCSQFEEVVKKRSVYRETGTSPEPYIIEKCDKAVQCELALRQPEDLDPNLSDNETQSERSYEPIYEKECSNDSFSFTTIDDDEHSTYDVSCKITPEKSFDQETITNSNRPEQKNIDSAKNLETPTCSSEQEIVTAISSPQVELNEEHESCCEASEMEIQEACQEDVGTECGKTDDSLLECPERQKDLKERTTISLQEDGHISTEKDGAICDKSKPEECEDSLFPDLSNENAQQQVGQERTEIDVEIDPQSKLSSSELKPSSADTTICELGNSLVQADNTDVSNVQDQPITPSKVSSSVTPTEPEPSCANIAGKAAQSVSTEDLQTKKAQKTPPTLKYPYFLRRQRCTSVTLEDAMLLLDAVNLHEYKSSTPKKAQTKHSVRPFATTKISSNPELTPTFAKVSTQLKENAFNAETLQPPAPETEEIIKEAGPANMHTECQQHDQETIPHTQPSREAVIDHGVLMVTPTKLTLVTEADSVSMEIEDKHHKITPTKRSSTPELNNTTPTTTPAKQSETTQAVDNDAANVNTEGQERDQITATSPGRPLTVEPNQNVTIAPPIMTSVMTSKQDHVFQEVEMIECPAETDINSQNHDYRSRSLLPTTATSSVAPGVDDKSVLNRTTEQGEMTQDTADLETQNDLVNISPPTVILPSDTFSESDRTQANPDETESVAQISGHPTLHSEGKENDATVSLAPLPPKPPPNPKTQHTLLLKMPGDTGDLCSSVLKTITSSATLSPAQLSAVVSAVRSTQNTGSSSGPSQSTTSNKRLVALPFSLQSVIKPHHKIIVIPRQCKIAPSQPIAKDKAIVLKKNPFQIDSTTTVISTSDVNLNPCFGNNHATPELNKQQSALDIKQTLPVQETSPCKNTVQVKLNRLSFPVSAQALSVTNMSPDESSTTQKNPPSRPPEKTTISETATKGPEAQLDKANLTSPVIDTNLSNKMNKPVQTSRRRRVKSTDRSSNIVRLSPVVSNDHSYPQHRMTKSQFLAKLEVSPVTQDSEKAGSSGKDVQKASLVDRLRSHLKKVQDVSNLTVETTDRTCITQDTSGPNQEQQSENLSLPDTVPHFDENKSASPIKTSPVTKSVASVRQIKRKNGPKTDNITPAKPVKKRRLKKGGASSENIPLRGNLAPMRNKLINSNALLSCVRKGLTKKSFLCKFCRKEFSKKKDIEEHIQVHAGKKPFQCNICHRRFSRTMELSRHLKRHNAEKKYHCSFCGKAFIEYNNLKRHTYIHTGEKPFSCPHCPKAFTQSGHMRTHIKSHHKDIKKQ